MANPSALTPTPGGFAMEVGLVSTNQILPTSGSPTQLALTNGGNAPIWIALGASTVVATEAAGLIILPGDTVCVDIGTDTYIAAITNEQDEAPTLYVEPST